MIRFLRWLDDVLFSPPHRFEDLLRDVEILFAADARAAKRPELRPSPEPPVSGERTEPSPPAPDS